MRVKFWLKGIIRAIIESICIRSNRSSRRRRSKRCSARVSVALLTTVAAMPLLGNTAAGQCEGPLSGQTFPVGDAPVSVTTGDFNGDGLVDLVTANRNSDDVSMLLNLNLCGNLSFLGDVNRDGIVSALDIAPFVDLLVAGEFQPEADINQDGAVTLLDVEPFVAVSSGE